MNFLFVICTTFLSWLGNRFGMSYKKISVWFNLYLQGGVVVIFSMMPSVASFVRALNNASLINILLLIFFVCLSIVVTLLYIKMIKHYGNDIDEAFDKCVDELIALAAVFKISYQRVNIIIFVEMFLTLLALCFVLAYLLL